MQVPDFFIVVKKWTQSFAINGKAPSTLNNYLRCLAHITLHFKVCPEALDNEQINDYLFHYQNLHKTPSESFFKHTVFGLRAIYKVLGMEQKRIALPQIKK